jgi:hypothetical protein
MTEASFIVSARYEENQNGNVEWQLQSMSLDAIAM